MAKFIQGDSSLVRRGKALLGASTALLAACAADAGGEGDYYIGETQQAICTTYPNCGPNIPGDPEVDPTPDPPPPPLIVSKPDVALQFSPCLPDNLASLVTTAVQGALPTAVDVRVTCSSGTQRVGAWFRATSGTDDAAARGRGLTNLSLLQGAETFGGYINSRYINQNVTAAWNSTPKVVNPDGTPNSGGPIHLNSLLVRYVAPYQVTSIIKGYDERPLPDVDFTMTTTDTLSTTLEGRIKCDSDTKVDADVSWLNYVTGALGIIIPPLGIYLILQDAFPSASDTETSAASVGCPAVKVFPSQILLPLGIKVLVSYSRANASSTGITVGGSYRVEGRMPTAAIVGSKTLVAAPGDLTSYGAYAAHATDMRAPLSYSWTSTGTVSNPSGSGTGITFSLAGRNQVGQIKNDRVYLTITDADGLTAQTSAAIRTTIRTPIEESPVCRNKPWLPVCQGL